MLSLLRPTLAATVLALAASGGVRAEPCASCAPFAPAGWWDDRALSAGQVADESPRIDVDGDGVTSRIAVTWERRDGGDGDIVLAISDDGGCSWTEAPVTSGPEDDRVPDVAVSLPRDIVGVVFARDGIVVAAISSDGGRSFAPTVVIDPSALPDTTSRPRLGMIGASGESHLHVAWAEGGRIRYARNLASGVTPGWLADPPLSDGLAGYSGWTSVDIAADTRSIAPGAESAITLLASGLAPGSLVPEIFALRSNDSGAAFWGDPATPATRNVPRRVSPPRASTDPARGADDPHLDVSDDGSGEFYTWEAAGFTDREAGEEMRGDARAEEGAAPTTIADWNDGATPDLLLGAPARAAAVAVIPNPLQRPPSPEAWFFFVSAASGISEIVGRRTELDTATAGWITPTCAPMPVSGVAPARPRGAVLAESCAADEDRSHVFVAWADSREGGSGIWWKRTDTAIAPPTAVTAGPGDCMTGGGLAVSWQLAPQCDVGRVRIEWSGTPGGTDGWLDASPVPPAQVTGLVPGAALFVRVIAIDEACNEAVSLEAAGVVARCGPMLPPNPVGGTLRAARMPSPDDVELRWAAPPVDAAHDAATSYDVYRSVSRARDGFAVLSAAGPQPFVDAGAAAPGTPLLHFYRVVARNSAGTSGDVPLP